jgi:outer membrane protein assembly factor BamB
MRTVFVVLLVFLLSGSTVFAAIPFGKAQDSSSANIVISPSTVTMNVGQSVPFNSSVSNLQGYPIYQWYINGTAVSGGVYSSWAFTPTAPGWYYISLGISTTVTVTNPNSGNSTPATILQPAGVSNTVQVLVTTTSPTGSFGYSNSTSQANGHGEQYLAVGSLYPLSVEANVTSISACMSFNFVSYPNGSITFSFAIYNEENGLIGSLIAQTSHGALTNADPSAMAWHTLSFASPVSLTPGAYWLMELDNGSGGNNIMISSNPNVNGVSLVEADAGGTTFPTTLNSPIYTPHYADCIFASYTTGSATNPIINPTPTLTPTTNNSIASEWPMFRNDLSHSGYSTTAGPATNQTLWIYPTGSNILSSPAVANGQVYVGSNKGAVYDLNAATGSMIWIYQTGGAIYSSPAVADGVVYVGSWDDSLYALNATNGEKLWSYQTGSYVQSSPAVDNGVVYIASYDANVYALNAQTGTLLWRFATGSGAVGSSPAVVNGIVYIGDNGGTVSALNASSGDKLWSIRTGDTIYSSPTVANGVLYIGADNNTNGGIYALNANTGSVMWNFQTVNLWVYSSPAVDNGVVYVGSYYPQQSGGNLYALDASNGVLLWSYPTGGEVFSSPAVANGIVYVGSEDNNIYALNATCGADLWSYQTGDAVGWSSPAIAGGVLYVGSQNGDVYAFSSSTLATTTTPTTTPTPTNKSATTVLATTNNSSTIELSINGNITGSQMSNITISTNQSATSLFFTVTGESGTTGFCNITIPKSAVPNGSIPTIYIDGQPAQNQGYTQDRSNYYVWYTTHFSTHQISIVFAETPSDTATQTSLLQIVYGVAVAIAIVAIVMVILRYAIRDKPDKA